MGDSFDSEFVASWEKFVRVVRIDGGRQAVPVLDRERDGLSGAILAMGIMRGFEHQPGRAATVSSFQAGLLTRDWARNQIAVSSVLSILADRQALHSFAHHQQSTRNVVAGQEVSPPTPTKAATNEQIFVPFRTISILVLGAMIFTAAVVLRLAHTIDLLQTYVFVSAGIGLFLSSLGFLVKIARLAQGDPRVKATRY